MSLLRFIFFFFRRSFQKKDTHLNGKRKSCPEANRKLKKLILLYRTIPIFE